MAVEFAPIALRLPGMACASPTKRNPNGRTATRSGARAHRDAGEQPCTACRDAERDHQRAIHQSRDIRSPKPKSRRPDPVAGLACARPTAKYPDGRSGTTAGHQAHRKAGEPPCAACREALRLKSESFNKSEFGKAYRHSYYSANKADHAARNLRAKSGMTPEDYRRLLDAQGGKCAICGSADPGGRWKRRGRFHVDHDHLCCPGKTSCGACVRGLLCGSCNVGLGSFRDNPDRLVAAAAYLMTRKGAGDELADDRR